MKRVSKIKASKLIEQGAFAVDMRSPVVFRFTKIKNTVNLPLTNLVNKLVGVKKDTKVLLIHDSADNPEIQKACNYASQLGILDVSYIDYDSMIAETVK